MSVPALRYKEFSGDWEKKKLGDVAETIQSGKSKVRQDIGEYTLYGSTGLIGFSDSFDYEGKVILIARVGANAGFIYEVDGNYCVSDNTLILALKMLNNYSFFFNLLTKFRLNQLVFGSGQPLITGGQLKSLIIPIPSLPEQTKIANFLTAVDEKITLLTQKADLLSQYKKGVMQQIFSQELRFKDDDGQEFPEWSISSLEQVSINYYQGINTAADKTEYIDGGVPIIQAKHITSEYLDFSDARGLNQLDYEKYKEKYNPKINDLLISNIGTLGKIVLVESKIKFLIAWNIFKVTLDSQKCYPRYIREYLKNIASNGYFDSIKTGNATKFINKTDMLAIEIILPSLPEQTKIANILTAVDEKITTNQTQLNAVKQYKQGLLQQMFV